MSIKIANESKLMQVLEYNLCKPFRCNDVSGLLTEYVERQKSALELGLTDIYGLHAHYDVETDH
jgi:hypothetical protein